MDSTRIEKKRKTTKQNTQKTETHARAMLHDAIRPIYNWTLHSATRQYLPDKRLS